MSQRFDLGIFLTTEGEGRSLHEYRRGTVIYRQGEPADSLFYIQAGQIRRTVLSRQGKEAVLSVLGPGDFFGITCLAGAVSRETTANALSDVSALRINKACGTQALREFPTFAQMFVSHLLVRTINLEDDLVDQLFNSSEKRLARVLLRLANFDKEGKPERIAGRISQEMLAHMVGTTRSRISYFMNRFRERGFIDYDGEIKVYSSLLTVLLED